MFTVYNSLTAAYSEGTKKIKTYHKICTCIQYTQTSLYKMISVELLKKWEEFFELLIFLIT